ncbi:MAG: hypothetical protein ACRDMZ_14815, partial [Solirubrobacteraceae bacterium]
MRASLAILAALAFAACAVTPVPRPPLPQPTPPQTGPPARPPDAGYRAKTPQGVDLVFDAKRGVYALTSTPDRYWVDGRYFRHGAEGWLTGPGLEGPWSP